MKKYPFPYVGAGNASYFEWAVLHIIFQSKPSDLDKVQIIANVPSPIADADWEDNCLCLGSDQFAHVAIASTYPDVKGGLDPVDEKNWDGRWFFASPGQVKAFNADIERYLIEVNNISPILLAFRDEDSESGGTKFSAWHTWSLKQVVPILPCFDDLLESFEGDSFREEVFSGTLKMLEEITPLEAKYQKYLRLGQYEIEAFLKGDIAPLKQLQENKNTYQKKVFETLVDKLNASNDKHQALMITYSTFLFSMVNDNLSVEYYNSLCIKIWQSAFQNNDTDLMAKTPNSLDLGQVINDEAFKLIKKGKIVDSISLYAKALEAGSSDLGLYCNALYVLQNDNTGLPVDPVMNEKFLKICLPFASKNPAIYFNASCLYVEMKDYDSAYDMIKKAVEAGYQHGKDIMKTEIKYSKFFQPLRETTAVLELF